MKQDNGIKANDRHLKDRYMPLKDFNLIREAIKRDFSEQHLHYEVMLMFGYYMGLRAVETRYIQIDDIRIHTKSLRIRNAKNNAIIDKPIPEKVWEILWEYLEKYPEKVNRYGYIFTGIERTANYCISYDAYRAEFVRYLKAAGLHDRGYSLHSLRYAFIIHFYRASNDLMRTKQAARHRNIGTTLRYLLPDLNECERDIMNDSEHFS